MTVVLPPAQHVTFPLPPISDRVRIGKGCIIGPNTTIGSSGYEVVVFGVESKLVEQAGGMEKVNFPMVIYGLKTVKDDSFPGGLRLDLGDVAVAYHVPILSRDTGKFRGLRVIFNKSLKKGLRRVAAFLFFMRCLSITIYQIT